MGDARAASQRVKILMFLWRLSVTGGIPNVVRSLLKGMDRDKFEINVCTVRPLLDEDRLDEIGEGIRFSSLGLSGGVSYFQKVHAALRLRSAIQKIEPDIVHTHSGVAWYLVPWLTSARHHAPMILEVHDSPQSRRVSRANNSVEGLIMKRLGAVPLVHSSAVGSDLARAARLNRSTIETIPIGIDVAAFANLSPREAQRRALGIGKEETVVTYVARLVASKNPSLFIDVAASVLAQRTACRFLLIGNGPEASALEEMAERAGLGNRFLLLRDVDDVSHVLAASDLFVSTSDYEGFGIAVLEAMAAGLPVVTTAAGGVIDLVLPDETGILAPKGDRDSLAEALISLVDDDAKRSEMGRRSALRAAEYFDVSRMTKAYEALYLLLSREPA